MTLLQLQQRAARRLGKNTTFDSATQARFKDFLNERHRELLRMPGMEALRNGIVTFASVDGTQQYALPMQGVSRVNRIWDETNRRKLIYKPLSWLRETDPDPQEGTPCYWIPAGMPEQVHTQPSDASSVFVDSTSASDTNTAYVEGITTGGYYQSKSVTMTGTTAVNISAAVTDWIRITKFYLSAAAVGTVTLHEDASGGTELSKIAIGDAHANYTSFLLYPTPSSAVTYTCDITRAITDMTNDMDEPLLPEDFHDLLITGLRLSEYEKTDDEARLLIAKSEWTQGKKDLRSWVINHPDWRPTWGGDATGISRLGAWTPADTWVPN